MTELKYQNLKFKIFGKTDKQVEEIIRPLETKYSMFRKLRNGSETAYLSIVKYLLLLFDPKTDLNRDFVRLEDRRAEAAKISGLNKLTDLKQHAEIYSCKDAAVLDVIQVLLTEVFHDIDYREWQTLHNELDEYTSARWDKIESGRKRGKDGDEVSRQDKSSIETLNLKSKLREDCKRIRELIAELDVKIFGDHTDIKETAYKSRFLDPESYSRASKQAI